MKTKETIQLIGPISNMPNGNIIMFEEATEHYTKLGYNVINPHSIRMELEHSHNLCSMPHPSEREIMAFCMLSLFAKAKKAIMLPEIEQSTGALIELIACAAYNIPVYEAFSDVPVDTTYIVDIKRPNCMNLVILNQ